MKQRLLLISNSTMVGEPYLEWTKSYINGFMAGTGIKKVLFFPYAGIGLETISLQRSFDVYEERVNNVFSTIGLQAYSVHRQPDALAAILSAEAVAVGGGNTFHLVYMMHKLGLMEVVKQRVEEGIPFMGWSAGANIACPTLRTTNDMPIIEPSSFQCLGLIPFQINPHYLDAHPEGHGGETRQQRIEEFLLVNRDITVAGLREASLLQVEGPHIELKGMKPMRIFRFGREPQEFAPGSDVSFLFG
jgi:dipeptidase E